VPAEAKEAPMRTLALFAFAAFVFSSLAGVIEALWERRARRRVAAKGSTVLHPLARYRFRSVRYPLSARALYHVGLFFGFLLVTYIVTLLLQTVVRSFVAQWF
jgi:hypothetical protein